MTMNLKALIAAPLAALLVMANAADLERINGWNTAISGSSADSYAVGVDTRELYQGKRVLSVKSLKKGQKYDSGTHSQTMSAFGYTGKRLRLSALIKAEGLDNWAGIWMGAIDVAGEEFFGKIMPHGVGYSTATAGAQAYWQPVSVVVEMPTDAKLLQFGLTLAGNGQIWATDLKFEEVGTDVPLTSTRVGIDAEERDAIRLKNFAGSSGAGAARKKALPYNLELK
jgi:hypothetical protein